MGKEPRPAFSHRRRRAAKVRRKSRPINLASAGREEGDPPISESGWTTGSARRTSSRSAPHSTMERAQSRRRRRGTGFVFEGKTYRSLSAIAARSPVPIGLVRGFSGYEHSQAPLRCAVYTRKSTEEGLEQEFNSLDAQREACEAYIASQAAWAGSLSQIAMTMAASPAAPWTALPCSGCLQDIEATTRRCRGGLQDRPPDPIA